MKILRSCSQLWSVQVKQTGIAIITRVMKPNTELPQATGYSGWPNCQTKEHQIMGTLEAMTDLNKSFDAKLKQYSEA